MARHRRNLFAPLDKPGRFRQRLRSAGWVALTALALLVLRLSDLQVLHGDEYRHRAKANSERVRSVEAPRGFILDRNGHVLAENRPSLDVYVVPAEVPDRSGLSRRLAAALNLLAEEIEDAIASGADRPFEPILLRRGIRMRSLTILEEQREDFPGVSVRVRPIRAYPGGDVAAHLLGYAGELTREQHRRPEYHGVRPGAVVGQRGVEGRLDTFLRGREGGERVEMDARGRLVRVVARLDPRSGASVTLTLDQRIQDAAEYAMAGRRGAVVAMDPRSGEILAWVSRPAYDPNGFARRLTRAEWEELASDPTHPMQDRPAQAQYPPGSIFKLIVAMAGLETGAITPATLFTCPGHFMLGTHTFDCWKKVCFWRVDLYQALARSCNVYFYQAALKTGIEPIAAMARAFGLGAPPGLGIGPEAPGLVPTPSWKHAVFGEPWSAGNTVVTGIGQGMVLATPLQLVTMVSAIANGGTLYQPSVIKKVQTVEGTLLQEKTTPAGRGVAVRPETLAFMRRAMWAVVNDGGTGGRARIPGLDVAGKTGTAQVVRKGERRLRADLKDHAWFVAFAPVDQARIAVAVLVENGGFGGQVAAPIARKILAAAPETFMLDERGKAGDPEPEEGD